MIPPGQSFEFVFMDTGSYNYYCQVHPWMTGIVTVASTFQMLNMTSTGSSPQEPQNKTSLQEELDLFRIQHEKQQLEKQQSEEAKTSYYVIEVGIPIFAIISALLFWFTRK